MGQNYKLQLLAPPQTRSAGNFGRSRVDEQLYDQYLSSMQRLRGRVYLSDGAIQRWELDDDDRFKMRGDEQGWHFLLIDEKESVVGCARYLVHPNTIDYERLRVSQSPLACDPRWGDAVRAAVEADLRQAQQENLCYVELGGWALSEEWRGTRAALEIMVASYALACLWGGGLGYCTATVRHYSASILSRMGGSPLKAHGSVLPSYEDPRYGCRMELLRFDSRTPAQRFAPLINQLKSKLATAVAIRRSRVPMWGKFAGELTAEHVGLLRMAPVYY